MEKENKNGKEHPLSIVINEAVKIFTDFGFEVVTGPELEDVWHNFDALNVPKDHPARDMQDTFYIKGKDDKTIRLFLIILNERFPKIELVRNTDEYDGEIIYLQCYLFLYF